MVPLKTPSVADRWISGRGGMLGIGPRIGGEGQAVGRDQVEDRTALQQEDEMDRQPVQAEVCGLQGALGVGAVLEPGPLELAQGAKWYNR